MAQRIRHLSTDQGIPGSNNSGVTDECFFLILLIKKRADRSIAFFMNYGKKKKREKKKKRKKERNRNGSKSGNTKHFYLFILLDKITHDIRESPLIEPDNCPFFGSTLKVEVNPKTKTYMLNTHFASATPNRECKKQRGDLKKKILCVVSRRCSIKRRYYSGGKTGSVAPLSQAILALATHTQSASRSTKERCIPNR